MMKYENRGLVAAHELTKRAYEAAAMIIDGGLAVRAPLDRDAFLKMTEADRDTPHDLMQSDVFRYLLTEKAQAAFAAADFDEAPALPDDAEDALADCQEALFRFMRAAVRDGAADHGFDSELVALAADIAASGELAGDGLSEKHLAGIDKRRSAAGELADLRFAYLLFKPFCEAQAALLAQAKPNNNRTDMEMLKKAGDDLTPAEYKEMLGRAVSCPAMQEYYANLSAAITNLLALQPNADCLALVIGLIVNAYRLELVPTMLRNRVFHGVLDVINAAMEAEEAERQTAAAPA